MTVNKKLDQWEDLQKIPGLSPLILIAPFTAFDPNMKNVAKIERRTIFYLTSNVSGRPWFNHLLLAALVISAQNFDPVSVYSYISTIHCKMVLMFGNKILRNKLKTMENWSAQVDECMRLYLSSAFSIDSQLTRVDFFRRYQKIAQTMVGWLASIKHEEREKFRSLLLPPANNALHSNRSVKTRLIEDQQKRRKDEVDALMPIYPELRAEAHFRWNLLAKIRATYLENMPNATNQVDNLSSYDYCFDYKEFSFNCKIWSSINFANSHQELKDLFTVSFYKKAFYFLEIVGISRIDDGSSVEVDQLIWFSDLLRNVMHVENSEEGNQRSKQWLETWGYTKSAFHTQAGGLLNWSNQKFFSISQSVSTGLLIPIDTIFYNVTFGLLAVDLFTTTGCRLNEALQISIDKQCLVRLMVSAPLGSKDQAIKIRYILRMIPKGERKDKREDFFISNETKRLLVSVAKILAEHYELKEGESLPCLPFNTLNRRAHRFNSAPYIFQLGGRHLTGQSISACIRFVLHGMNITTKEGKTISIRPHLLRHGFATHAVQVEKIPIDIVGQWLHQKNLSVSEYYSRVTDSMVAESADQYLAKIAANIDVDAALVRSPIELKETYEAALSKSGTLAEVLGGSCTSHGYCKARFDCIGCAAKVPDPEKRQQVIKKKEWAVQEISYCRSEGLLPEVGRLQQLIRDSDAELREMDMIEQYRKDESKF